MPRMRKHSKPEARLNPVRVQVVESTNLTVEQWCLDETLLRSSARLLSDPTMKLILQALSNSNPANLPFTEPVTIEQRGARQIQGEGYRECLANLERMSQVGTVKIAGMPEATFEPEETRLPGKTEPDKVADL